MIEVRDLVKTFDGFAALRGATLTVPKGAVYGLVGPNGAGKSTLLRHITGVFRQDSGEVLVNGVPVYENRHVKENIVSIPDDWFYYNQSTIREMAALYAGLYPRFDWERFERLRELFQLPEKKTIRRMSKGMQRQAAFWITISCLPEYLVLDEPVDGLDPVMRRQVWQVLLDDVAHPIRPAGHHRQAPGGLQNGRGADSPRRAANFAPFPCGSGAHLYHARQQRGDLPPYADHRSRAAGGHSPDAGGNFHL